MTGAITDILNRLTASVNTHIHTRYLQQDFIKYTAVCASMPLYVEMAPKCIYVYIFLPLNDL